jgi:hypothetical protein
VATTVIVAPWHPVGAEADRATTAGSGTLDDPVGTGIAGLK